MGLHAREKRRGLDELDMLEDVRGHAVGERADPLVAAGFVGPDMIFLSTGENCSEFYLKDTTHRIEHLLRQRNRNTGFHPVARRAPH